MTRLGKIRDILSKDIIDSVMGICRSVTGDAVDGTGRRSLDLGCDLRIGYNSAGLIVCTDHGDLAGLSIIGPDV